MLEKIKESINSKFGNKERELLESQKLNFKKVNIKGVILEGEINFNAFKETYSECIYSYDDGKNILLLFKDNAPILPGTVFEAHLSVYNEEDGGIAVNYFLKEGVSFNPKSGIREDNLREEMIAGLVESFEENGFELCEEMECMSSITPNEDKIYKNYLDFEKEVKGIIKDLGMTYVDKSEAESYEELECETREGFLKEMNAYSKEELNKYLRSELNDY